MPLQQLSDDGLRFGPVGDTWVHFCIDMQRMFAEETEWHAPWLARTLPNVIAVTEIDPARTLFTRFIPPRTPQDAAGTWRRYYQRWDMMTRDRLDEGLIDLVPELLRYVPPARIVNKPVMSAWTPDLHAGLRGAGVDTLILTGSETEVCVLATVMGAIDLGYRVILVTDAICSGADETHDAMLGIYRSRFGMQVETITTADLVAARQDGMMQEK